MQKFIAPKPKEGVVWDAIIIGSGPAALTASIYTTRGAASTLIIGGENWGGQLMLTTLVDNYPGLPAVQGPDLMNKMKHHATLFGGEFLTQSAESVNLSVRPFEVASRGKTYKARTVIVATGAETRWLGVPGEEKLRGRGVSSCAPCDAPFFKSRVVAVVGGGDSAMEEALVLTKYASSVTLIHRRDVFRASQIMQQKVFNLESQGKIKILWNTEVTEVKGKQKVESIAIKNNQTDQTSELTLDGLFIAVGHIPSTSLFRGKIELDEKGYVKVFDHTKTSKEGVFVAGDVHDYHYKQAITAAGFGCMAGMEALKYLDKEVPTW